MGDTVVYHLRSQYPPYVAARQFKAMEDYLGIVQWMRDADCTTANEATYSTPEMSIQVLGQGRRTARPGDYIVQVGPRHFDVCPRELFEQLYIPVRVGWGD